MQIDKIKSIKKIGIENTSDLVVQNNHNFIANNFLVHNSGYGKGLFAERILEAYHKAGYTVICIADPKEEMELAYAMFNANEEYQTRSLRATGKEIYSIPTKLYHPFTFDIPTDKKLPEINFYTIPLKSLGRAEWSLIAESGYDTDTIRLCLNGAKNINKNDGIFSFLHYLQDIIKGSKGKKEVKPDPKNFYLSSTSGTLKSLQDISNYLQPFKNNYFLSSDDSEHNLNWKQILNDNSHYHVFLTNWSGKNPHDDKIKAFNVLYCLRKIVENRSSTNKPVIIFVPEVKKLMPFKPKGFQEFLAESMKESLSMIRSMGEGGMSAVLDTQVYSDVDESVRRASSRMFLGELTSDDIEKLNKSVGMKKEIKKMLSSMESQGCYLWVGKEDLEPFKMFVPSHAHAEEHYKFDDLFRQKYPEKMKNYSPLVKEMRENYNNEQNKSKEIVKKREDAIRKQEERKRKEREQKKNKTDKKDTEKVVNKTSKNDEKKKLFQIVKRHKEENPEVTDEQLGVLVEKDRSTISRWFREYKKQKEKRELLAEEDIILRSFNE